MRPFLAAYHWNHCWSFIHSCTPTALKHLSRSFLTSPGTGMYKKQGESRPISVQHPAPPANVRPPWGHNAANSMSCLFRACPWAADLVLEHVNRSGSWLTKATGTTNWKGLQLSPTSTLARFSAQIWRLSQHPRATCDERSWLFLGTSEEKHCRITRLYLPE